MTTDHDDAAAAFAEHPPTPGPDGVPAEWTEQGVGALLADEMNGQWIHVTGIGWHQWDGCRWKPVADDYVHAWAQEWIVEVGARLVALPGDTSALLRNYSRYREVGKLERAVTSARRRLLVCHDELDQHPHLLNTPSGVVDLRTGELGPHDPALLITKITGAAYVPGAEHPDVAAVIACMTPAVAGSMQQYFGVAASGSPGDDDIAVFDGKGSNGKTTLLGMGAAALGDYGDPIHRDLLMRSKREAHATWTFELRGLRLGYLEETEEDGGFALERLKALTGGSTVTARKLYQTEAITFAPTHTLVIATNHRPNVNNAEHATWRRLKLVPFPHRYGDEPESRPADPGLRGRVTSGREQREAALAWIVEGAVLAYEAGEGEIPLVDWCGEILEATAAWRREEDVLAWFLDAHVEITGNQADRMRGSELYERFTQFCAAAGRKFAPSLKNFYRSIEAHDLWAGVTMRDYQGAKAVWGVRLRPEQGDYVPPEPPDDGPPGGAWWTSPKTPHENSPEKFREKSTKPHRQSETPGQGTAADEPPRGTGEPRRRIFTSKKAEP